MKKILILAIAMIAIMACTSNKHETSQTEVNWASFNMRYDNPEDSLNNWQYRRDSIGKFILAQDLDIIGMQEVLHNMLVDLQERLPGYDYEGVGRDDGKEAGEYAPLFYKRDRFERLDGGTFWLSQYPDSVGFIGWDGACCRIATWAKLRDKQNEKVFMAVNTHFDHVGVEARRQAALLIIDKIKEIVGDQPAVLTGDFNVSDTSEAYKTITQNAFKLIDTHKAADQVEGQKYTWHEFGQEKMQDREKIDFVFATPSIHCTRSFIPQEHTVDSLKPETQWGFLSDHNPVITHLQF